MTKSGKFRFVAILIVGIICIYKTGTLLKRYIDISRNGEEVVATVVEIEKRSSSRGSNSYPVYEYHFKNQSYRSQEAYENYFPPEIGSKITVIVDKRSPQDMTTGLPILWLILTSFNVLLLVYARRMLK